MGVDYRVSVGPFFKCHCPIVDKTKEIGGVCVNKECRQYERPTSGKFCPNCGGPAGNTTVVERKPLRGWYEVSEAVDEALYMPNCNYGPIEEGKDFETHIWLINKTPNNPILTPGYVKRRFSMDMDGDSAHTVIQPAQISMEVKYLSDNFASEEKVLRELYGTDNVEICWGIIQYAS